MIMEVTSRNLNISGAFFLSQESVKPSSSTPDHFEIQSDEGDKYSGRLVNGKKHGYGELTHLGCVFKGDWVHDELPFGSITFPEGSTYEGEIKASNAQGKGTMKCHDGNTYDGIWEDGCIVSGKYCCSDGVYEGQFKNGLFHGMGTYVEAVNKVIWTGEWVEGALTAGSRRDGKKCYYLGQFKDFAAHGFGTLYLEMNISEIDPDHLRHQYKRQVFSGIWTEGDLSSGIVKGNGRMIYKGALKYNMFHGFGTYYHPDGKIVRGMFKEDVFTHEVPSDYLEEKQSPSIHEITLSSCDDYLA